MRTKSVWEDKVVYKPALARLIRIVLIRIFDAFFGEQTEPENTKYKIEKSKFTISRNFIANSVLVYENTFIYLCA